MLLNKYNNAKLTEDGVFGPATENAVLAWQKDRGLQPDGVVGEKSWSQ
jgi:peptidoglycan hydrolase-like protein with peptidoglycan-binding domain